MYVPSFAIGTRAQVLTQMKKWCRTPTEPVPTIEVESSKVVLPRFDMKVDLVPKVHVHLVVFSTALESVRDYGVNAPRIVHEILDANDEAWWVPYLFDNFSGPALRPVSERLLKVCRDKWPLIYSFGGIFYDDANCVGAPAPFGGLVPFEDRISWLTDDQRETLG